MSKTITLVETHYTFRSDLEVDQDDRDDGVESVQRLPRYVNPFPGVGDEDSDDGAHPGDREVPDILLDELPDDDEDDPDDPPMSMREINASKKRVGW